MKYMGSKNRLSKFIVPIIQSYITKKTKGYLEPFVGGANIIDKIECNHKYASDNNKYLIALLKYASQNNIYPKEISKQHYSEVRECFNKQTGKYEDYYIGLVGFLASCKGRFFDGGYSGVRVGKDGKVRDYYDESKRNLQKQSPNLKGINFSHCDFRDIDKNIGEFVIYCDPPYKGTKQYSTSKDFPHEEFWQWCRDMSENNNVGIVLISELVAPSDFVCIWEQKVVRAINNTKSVPSTEKLFVHKVLYDRLRG